MGGNGFNVVLLSHFTGPRIGWIDAHNVFVAKLEGDIIDFICCDTRAAAAQELCSVPRARGPDAHGCIKIVY